MFGCRPHLHYPAPHIPAATCGHCAIVLAPARKTPHPQRGQRPATLPEQTNFRFESATAGELSRTISTDNHNSRRRRGSGDIALSAERWSSGLRTTVPRPSPRKYYIVVDTSRCSEMLSRARRSIRSSRCHVGLPKAPLVRNAVYSIPLRVMTIASPIAAPENGGAN